MEKTSILQLSSTTRELILNLIIRINSIIEDTESTNEKEVLSSPRLTFILEDFSTLAEAMNIIQMENSSIYLEEFIEKLNLLHECMKVKDEIMFKDLMEFEIKPLLEHWVDMTQFTGRN